MRDRLRCPEAAPAGTESTTAGGRPVEPALRRDLEHGLGHDIGAVRVHDDAAAAASARRHGAAAVTVGHDIAFAPGRHDPDLPRGRTLLAHEVWHTLQQGAADPGTPASPGHESQADAAAAAMLTGTSPPTVRAARLSVQRQSGEVKLAEHKAEVLARRPIRYTDAKASNQAYDKRFGFGTTLAAAAGGRYRALADRWTAGRHDAFADAVAGLQFDLNLRRSRSTACSVPPPGGASRASARPWPASSRCGTRPRSGSARRPARSASSGAPAWRPAGRSLCPRRRRGGRTTPSSPPTSGGWARFRWTTAARVPPGHWCTRGSAGSSPRPTSGSAACSQARPMQVWNKRADYDLLRAGF